MFGIIKRVDNGKELLITSKSLVEMIKQGYINNAAFQFSIKQHKNKVNNTPNLHPFNVRDVKGAELGDIINELKNKYTYLIEVDNKGIKTISWLHMEPFKFIYDLSGHLCALHIRDEYNNVEIVSLHKFERMSKPEYNRGKYSPVNLSNNVNRVLNYIDISLETYNTLKEELGIGAVSHFKMKDPHIEKTDNKRVYRCEHIDKVNMEVIIRLFADIKKNDEGYDEITCLNVYYAIPRPEKFRYRNDFLSAMNEANHLDRTRYSQDKFVIVEATGLDVVMAKNILKNNWDTLRTGKYLDTYTSIDNYIITKIKEEKDKSLEEHREKVFKLIESYNNGTFKESMLKDLNFKVLDDSRFRDSTHRESEMFRIVSYRGKPQENDKYMRLATLEELAEEFNLSHMLKKENNNDTDVQDKESINMHSFKDDTDAKVTNNNDIKEEISEVLENFETVLTENNDEDTIKHEEEKGMRKIETIYLTEDFNSRLEVKVENDNKVCAYLVINNDTIRIDESEKSFIEYIKSGIDKCKIEAILKRALVIFGKKSDINEVMSELL